MARKKAVTLFPSSARTASPTAVDLETGGARSAVIVVDMTAINLTPAVTVTISGKDPLNGGLYTILASAALGAVARTVLRIGPGLPVTANVSANDILPEQIRIAPTHGDADSATYSISITLIP